MVGIPGERRSDFEETIKCVRECAPDTTSLSIFFPYPGTELHRVCKQMGLLDRHIVKRNEREIATLDLPGFSREEIQREYDWFDYKVNRGIKPRYPLLKGGVYRRIASTYRFLLPAYRCLSSIKKALFT